MVMIQDRFADAYTMKRCQFSKLNGKRNGKRMVLKKCRGTHKEFLSKNEVWGEKRKGIRTVCVLRCTVRQR